MQKVKCPKCHFVFNEDIKPGIQEASYTCPRCGSPFTFITDNDNMPQNVSVQPESIPIQHKETIINKEVPTTENKSDIKIGNPDKPIYPFTQHVCLPTTEDNNVTVSTDIDTTIQIQKTKWWKSKIAKIIFKCVAYIVFVLIGVAVVFIVGRIVLFILLALVFFTGAMSKK
jgi:hypothetical protein